MSVETLNKVKGKKPTAKHLKAALMYYLRFDRGLLCADEASLCGGRCDVLSDSKSSVSEFEVKVTKHDLWSGENKKKKHHELGHLSKGSAGPNFFYICVSDEMKADVEKFCEEKNPKYGIVLISTWRLMSYGYKGAVMIGRTAKDLRPGVYESMRERISMRLCSAVVNTKMRELKKHV